MLMRTMISVLLLAFISTGYCSEQEHEEHKSHQDEEIVSLSKEVIKQYRIEIVKAGPQTLEVTRDILGKIVPNANKTIYIYPRYGGIIKKMTKFLGDKAREGELLAKLHRHLPDCQSTLSSVPLMSRAPLQERTQSTTARP